MKNSLLLMFVFTLAMMSCQDDDILNEETSLFAVANRVEGTVTLFDAMNQELAATITLPDGAQPTYVVQSPENEQLLVSDFSSEKVWVYDSNTLDYVDAYDIELGGFHMWVSDRADQIWVNNIVSKSTSVLDSHTGELLANFYLDAPGIKFADDAAQHDVFVSPTGSVAFVSVFSKTGANYVMQYNTRSLQLMKVIEVGGDPHLSGNRGNLYILSQADQTISEYTYGAFVPTGQVETIPNAHGVTPVGNNDFLVTNISGREVVSYDSGTDTVVGSEGTFATAGVAHNLAYDNYSGVAALTISGGSSVEFFSVANDGSLSSLSTIESGANPFGIWAYTSDSFSPTE